MQHTRSKGRGENTQGNLFKGKKKKRPNHIVGKKGKIIFTSPVVFPLKHGAPLVVYFVTIKHLAVISITHFRVNIKGNIGCDMHMVDMIRNVRENDTKFLHYLTRQLKKGEMSQIEGSFLYSDKNRKFKGEYSCNSKHFINGVSHLSHFSNHG